MTRTTLLLIAGAGLMLLVSAQADTVYRWVDAQGHVHYSQTPPPNSKAGAKAVDITPPPPDQTSLAQTQDMEQAVTDKQQAQQALTAKAKQEADKKAQKQKACEAARKRVQRYDEVNRVAHKDKNGNVVYDSGDDLVKLRQQAQEQADKICAAVDSG
jgi:type IV secretory pathway VirB10-like protein